LSINSSAAIVHSTGLFLMARLTGRYSHFVFALTVLVITDAELGG